MKFLTSIFGARSLSVPIQFLIDSQQKGYSRKLRLFLLLKLMFPSGKMKLDRGDLEFLELVDKIKSRKTSLSYFKFFLDQGWLIYNNKTGYCILKSLDRIRKENDWKVRWAVPVNFGNYNKLKALSGAAIFGYLHKDFQRKNRKKKSVLVKGGTCHFHSLRFFRRFQSAPVSVYGVTRLFGLSPSTASRLKEAAQKEKYIDVKKNFGEKVFNKKAMLKSLKFLESKSNIVFHEGYFRFQLIDTIFPLFLFVRRKKLKP